MRAVRNVTLALAVAVVAGCGSGNPWDLVKVTGKVTYDDGTIIPVGSMKLYFVPQTPPIDSKTSPRQGVAGVNASDGSFDAVTTYKYGDGLIAGKHKVVVAAYESGARDLSPKVPKQCSMAATTPLEIDTANLPLEIKVPKPNSTR
jgi:hypothetical protein